MKNTLNYSNGAQRLLANSNDGTNRIFINGTEIPSTDWTGSGTYTQTVEGATISITKIADTSGNIMLQKIGTDEYQLVRSEAVEYLTTTGDTKDNVTTFTSSDVADGSATAWTTVSKLDSGEKHSSIFAKVSQMFKNIRYLYKMLGTTDISSIGSGTVTNAIYTLNDSLANKSGDIIVRNKAIYGTGAANTVVSKSVAISGYTALGVVGLSSIGTIYAVTTLYDYFVNNNTLSVVWNYAMPTNCGLYAYILYKKNN